MTAREIFDAIVAQGLYPFKAQDPENVVKQQLRRHTKGLEFLSAHRIKYFALTGDGRRYTLLDRPEEMEPGLVKVAGKKGRPKVVTIPTDAAEDAELPAGDDPTHWELQWRLLDLGA